MNRWIGNSLGAAVALSAFAALPAAAHSAAAGHPAAPLQQVPFPCVLRDAMGNNWDVQQDGRIGDGGNNIYDGGGKLFVGADKTQWVSPQQQAGFDPASNEVVLVPAQIDGLTITRRVAVNARQNWCRWIEVLENPGAAAVHTQVHVNFSLGGQIANSRDLLDEKKSRKNVGVATFDGNHSLVMIGAAGAPGSSRASPISRMPTRWTSPGSWTCRQGRKQPSFISRSPGPTSPTRQPSGMRPGTRTCRPTSRPI